MNASRETVGCLIGGFIALVVAVLIGAAISDGLNQSYPAPSPSVSASPNHVR